MLFFMIGLIGYLFGCINGSQIIGKYKDVNIKSKGMRNPGASNTLILLGWKYGLVVALIDVLKAIISMTFTFYIIQGMHLLPEAALTIVLINGLFVIVGHNYPVNMNFKGGKGTASFVGVLLVIDWRFALVSMALFILVTITTDYFVVGTLFMYLAFIIFTAYNLGVKPSLVALLYCGLFFLKHIENFKRMAIKKEARFSTHIRN